MARLEKQAPSTSQWNSSGVAVPSGLRQAVPLPPVSDQTPVKAGALAFRIVGVYLAVGLDFLMVITKGAPFVATADTHWRITMPQTATFFAVTAALIYFLARHGFQEVLKAKHETARAKLELVHRLAAVAEWKDDTIGGHNYRIARCSQILARRLGFSEHKQALIFHGAILHDIGKVGMPDYLVRKSGRFTEEEKTLMQRHVILGAALLEGSNDELLVMARTIALSHHENWDGTGYPQKLAGSDIPLEGRIVAVCDVFDALLSARPYKEPWHDQEAVRFIQEQSGKKFDPTVVEALAQSLPEMLAVRDEAVGDPWAILRQEPKRQPSVWGLRNRRA